ncbi:hypothetical protein OS965_37340 [Streptomyces sp. H27-G5]|uniref:hypothetical protein n=1 Tax=Streptomyces sp. H27-G5 TaxID=2996698 RepID=UPI0022712C4F|nr:hypothetical protein [Streptomyces sp. H27-G5]MCY0923740.1 hypothetical protein [Streptomyces sp. H27-G5]
MDKRRTIGGLGAAALMSTMWLAGTAHAEPGPGGAVPEHAVVVCDSATMYADYITGRGPVGVKRVLHRGDKVGHTRGAHAVFNGWAAMHDFGPNDWGYLRRDCIGRFGSW